MDPKLALGVRVAAEYAVHLTRDDGVSPARAIALASRAVVRAVRASSLPAVDAGVGFFSDPLGIPATLMGVGSILSGVGWVHKVLSA